MSNLRNILSGVKKKSLTDILAPVKSPVKTEVPQLDIPIKSAITQAVGQVEPTPEARRITPELPKTDSLVSQLKTFAEPAQEKRASIQEEVKSLRTADLPGIRNLPVAKTQQQLKEAEKFGITLLPPTPRDPEYKGFQESFAKFTAEEQPFGAGLIEEITPFAKKVDPTIAKALEAAEKEAPFEFKAGEITGKTAELLGGYLAAGGIVGKLGITGAKGFGAKQGMALLLDAIAQTPFEMVEFVNNDKSAQEDVKQYVKNRAVDAAFNLAFGAVGEVAKGVSELRKLKQANDPEVIKAIQEGWEKLNKEQKLRFISEEEAYAREIFGDIPGISEELGTSLTAKEILEEQAKVAQDVGVETSLKQFDRTPQQVIEDFNQWRRQNFGGAFGQVSPGDEQALRELYKETTGIDLDVALREASEAFPTRQVVPELPTPVRPTEVAPEVPSLRSIAEDTGIPKATENVARLEISTPRNVPKLTPPNGNAETFRSKVVREIPKKKTTVSDVAQKFKTQFTEDLNALKVLERNVKGGISSAEDSIYKMARLQKGAPEQASNFIRTELEPVIKKAEQAGIDYKDLGDYALAIHAKDVNAAGLTSGFTDAEIDSVIRELYSPQMEASRKELLAVSDKLLDQLKQSNLISDTQLTGLKNKWKNYMPLSRSFDDEKVDFSIGLGKAFSNVSSPIKGLKGSERSVIDPIESMIKNVYKTTDAVSKNEVGVQLARLAELDTASNFIRKLSKGENIGRKNVVNVTLNGEKVAFEVEPEVFKVFNNLNQESSNWLIDILSKPASTLRAGATLTPEFALRNPFRDVQNAFVVSESGFNPITDFARGLYSTIKKDELYTQFLKEGGGYGNILSMDRQAHKKVLEDALSKPVTEKFVNVMTPKGFIELMRGISDLTESATKVGEFGAALRSGATPKEAAFRARDLMDFAKAGSSIRPANKIIAFLNANIQGKEKLIRAIKENPKKVVPKAISSMALPTVGVFVANEKFASDEQKAIINGAPDWLKSTFWLVAIPGTDKVARIPKPFDLSAIANVTERSLEYLVNNDKEAFDGLVGQTLKDQSIPVMISGILPIIEAVSNYSFFRESPIVPLREQGLQRKDQFDAYTSEAAKAIAKGTSAILGEDSNLASPRAIDYILKSSTGGLGTNVLDLSDWLLDKTGIVDKVSKPAKGVTQLPGIKGFMVSETMSDRAVGEVYEAKDKLSKKKRSLALTKQRLTREELIDLKFLERATKQISDISKEIRTITNDPKLSSEVKKRKIDELIKERNNISRKTMEELNE